jgi:hypothetical protein
MNKIERIAVAIVEDVIPGSTMNYRSEQSAGQYDFDLRYADGVVIPLEVTMSTVQAVEAAGAALSSPRQGGAFVPVQRCRFDWWIQPLPTARIAQARKKVDTYLAGVEQEGFTCFFSPLDAVKSPAVRRIYNDLAIEGGSVVRWAPPGRIGINIPSADGGLVTGESVRTAVEEEAFKCDNRRKLGEASAAERHLFVFISYRNFLPWVAMVDGMLPKRQPRPPPEVTHAWAVASGRTAGEYVVWRVSQVEGWRDLGLVRVRVPL